MPPAALSSVCVHMRIREIDVLEVHVVIVLVVDLAAHALPCVTQYHDLGSESVP